jgi:hypothetical protein
VKWLERYAITWGSLPKKGMVDSSLAMVNG